MRILRGFPDGSVGKESAFNAGVTVWSLFDPGSEDPLEKEMATNSGSFAWKSHGKKSLAGPEFEKYKQNAFVYV